jgi:hypothetical protein
MTYPRINQYRHLLSAGRWAALGIVPGVVGMFFATVALAVALWLLVGGPMTLAGQAVVLFVCGSVVALLASAGMLARARGQIRIAERNRIGADSEDHVTAALAPLRREGWWTRHSLDWRGIGDIDNTLLSPGGALAFAVEQDIHQGVLTALALPELPRPRARGSRRHEQPVAQSRPATPGSDHQDRPTRTAPPEHMT